jgi:uncharacterized protein (DUF58 family)
MNRRATERLGAAAAATVLGALIAALAGLPEAAVLAAPWAVLLALGLSKSGPSGVSTTVGVAPDRVLVGDNVAVTTSISGAAGTVHVTSLPSAGFWPQSDEAADRDSARTHDVLIGGHATIHSALPAAQWGMHDLGRVRIVVTEPYGLFRWEGEAGTTTRVRVHPNPSDLRNLLAPRLVRRVTGAHRSKAVGRGVEYADIRPLSTGDSLRDINWRASARSREMWVSQRHPDQATDVILVLDSFVESGHDVRTVFGLAIEAAMALAESHLKVTDRVGLVELGGVVRWVSPGTGQIQLQRMADTLLATGLFANVADRDLRGLMTRALPPRSFVVAVTPLLDDRFIDALFALGGHGHDVAVIECESAWPEQDGNAVDESSQLALRFWQANRQMVRDRLAEHGIAVAGWRRGGHLDLALDELTRRRQRTVHVRHR